MSRAFSAAAALLILCVAATPLPAAPPADRDTLPLGGPVVSSEFIFTEAPFASCHASTIAETPDGSLVAAWFGGTREGAGDVAIWSSRKEPGETTWSAPVMIGDADGDLDGDDVPCWNPVLFQPKDGGPLALFFKQARTIPEWQGVLQFSHDGGKTWGDRRVLPECFIGPVKNKPVELSDGTILCPTSTEHNGWRVHFEFIPDFNKTWSRTEAINTKSEGGAIQPSVLFHRDGRLQAICRNRDGSGKLWQTWSEDEGRTWSNLEPTTLPNPCSGTDAVTLADGRQFLVYNHTNSKTGGRDVLNAAVSDDGENWRAVCELQHGRGEFSYPSVIQGKDGTIHIVYTWRRKQIVHAALDPAKIQGVPIVDGAWPAEVGLAGSGERAKRP